ncbi:myeloid-associated differentiation marker-like protein 2 [Conger conger]|uniref:myeloid-associated differentiation marker-like protein 2 n=1 Tax=Conger conger TaxID=82655 RepID=UPI002A59F570|nr:myeloid-associated differentiation marker-like protein 2 [Conger conger]
MPAENTARSEQTPERAVERERGERGGAGGRLPRWAWRGGPLLNLGALLSRRGGARLCQLGLGGAVLTLLLRVTGHTGAPYGWLCAAVWAGCLAASLALVLLEVTRLHACLSVSWGDLTAAHAAVATLLQAGATALYAVYTLLPGCGWGACGLWPYRVALGVCSGACGLAYAAEVLLPARPPAYMATPPGLLKAAQACVGGVVLGALANGSEPSRPLPARVCVGVYAVCFATSLLAIGLAVAGRAGAANTDRALAAYALLATLLYLGASVAWPLVSFDARYGGAPARPPGCPRWGGRGRCPWDARLLVAVSGCLNLLLYLADLLWVSSCPRPVSRPALQLV